MVEEVKQKFSGKWKMDRSENFDEFMSAMGLNFMIRKMASLSKPENEIVVGDDGTITIRNNTGFMKNEQTFKLNEEYEDVNTHTKKRFKNMPTYENGKLRVTPTPAEPMDGPYPEYVEREITDAGEMLLTIKVKDVVCKRWFKKL